MTTFTPAKKAFLVTTVLYALLLLLGYLWYTASSVPKKALVKLTVVPVTLSMFQAPTLAVAPTPTVVEEPLQPEPSKPVERLIEEPIAPPKEQAKSTPKPEPKVTPIKTLPPPKKTDIKQHELPEKTFEKPKEPLQETPSKPSVKPAIVPQKNSPPPTTQAIKPPTKETTTQPLIHPNQSASAEQSYLSELNTIIAQHAYNSYPRRAKRRNWQGEVLIQFTLLPNGRITRLSIIESSGRNLLDNAALQIFQVKMNQQFKPFPAEITRTQWRIEVPVSYHLN